MSCVRTERPFLQGGEAGGLPPGGHPPAYQGQGFILALEIGKATPVNRTLKGGDSPRVPSFIGAALGGGFCSRLHMRGPAQRVSVTMLGSGAIHDLEVVVGKKLQPTTSDGVWRLHGTEVDQWLVVGANKKSPMLEEVAQVIHEEDDGHEFPLGRVVARLAGGQLVGSIEDYPLLPSLDLGEGGSDAVGVPAPVGIQDEGFIALKVRVCQYWGLEEVGFKGLEGVPHRLGHFQRLPVGHSLLLPSYFGKRLGDTGVPLHEAAIVATFTQKHPHFGLRGGHFPFLNHVEVGGNGLHAVCPYQVPEVLHL